jgi:hypothetical protein
MFDNKASLLPCGGTPYSTQKYYVNKMPSNTHQNFVKIGIIYFTSPQCLTSVIMTLDYVLKIKDIIYYENGVLTTGSFSLYGLKIMNMD